MGVGIRQDNGKTTVLYVPTRFWFSSHCLGVGQAASVEDTSGDEVDGMDETLCPVDYQESGMITDDERFEEVGRPLSLVYAFLS